MNLLSIKTSIGAGVTKPHLVSLSDNLNYILKFPGNPEQEKALISENICHELAKRLDLPVLPKAIVEINFSNVDQVELLAADVEKKPGKGFATLFCKDANIINDPELIMMSNNKFDFLNIFIFDILIGNFDRNRGNLLYDDKFKKILIIDHTHVFAIGPIFRSKELNELKNKKFSLGCDAINKFSLKLFYDLKNKRIFNSLEQRNKLTEFLSKIKAIKKNDLIKIIKDTQTIWYFSDNDVESLIEFLFSRFKRIDEVIKLLKLEERK